MAPAPWEPLGGSEDGLVPFAEILAQISKANDLSPYKSAPAKDQRAKSTKHIHCLEEAIPGGQSLRTVPFKPQSSVGRFFQEPIGILPQRDLCGWDRERLFTPQRTWPSRGSGAELYDFERAGKEDWQPAPWHHTGESFPPRPAFLSQRYPDPRQFLGSSASEAQRGAAASIPRPASAPLAGRGSARGSSATATPRYGSSATAGGSRPGSARSGTGSRVVGRRSPSPACQASRPSAPPHQASAVRNRPGSAPTSCGPSGSASKMPTTSAESSHPDRIGRASGTSPSRASRPRSARSSGRPNSARSTGRPTSARSNRSGFVNKKRADFTRPYSGTEDRGHQLGAEVVVEETLTPVK